MTPVAVVRHERHLDGREGDTLWMWCPGCRAAHSISFSGDLTPRWTFDGNMERPTISPSILAYDSAHLCDPPEHHEVCEDHETCGRTGHLLIDGLDRDTPLSEYTGRWGHNLPHTADPAWGNCHSFVRNGQWQFLPDSAHALAGQTVDMVPLPEWLL